jgi:arginine N-succinyltransferase
MSPETDLDFDRFIVRPATVGDIDSLERFAIASAYGITTLPADRDALLERLSRSHRSFENRDAAAGDEIYLFVLEDIVQRRVVGTSGIAASAGLGRHFFSYRNETVVHSGSEAGGHMRVHTLNLCQDLTGATLLTSFYIEPTYEGTAAAQLLSRARLLFIAQHPERFSERIAAESPGLADEAGHCPFWEAVGRKFFGLDYPEVERLAVGRTKAFIGQLLPQSPLYVALLPEEAQWAIGQLHPVAIGPFEILEQEGFDSDTYVDIFDAGPISDARVSTLRTVRSSRVARAAARAHDRESGEPSTPHLVSIARQDEFRAVIGHVRDSDGLVSAQVARRLGANGHALLRISPLISADSFAGGQHE